MEQETQFRISMALRRIWFYLERRIWLLPSSPVWGKGIEIRLGTLSLALVSSPLMRLERVIPDAPLAQRLSAGTDVWQSLELVLVVQLERGCCCWRGWRPRLLLNVLRRTHRAAPAANCPARDVSSMRKINPAPAPELCGYATLKLGEVMS